MALSNSLNPSFSEINLKPSTAVTQATSATTGVTANKASGQITTVVQNIAAAGEVTFAVSNNIVTAKSVPVVSIASGSVGGTPSASVTAVEAGTFSITISNLHATVAETGTLVLNFAVIGA